MAIGANTGSRGGGSPHPGGHNTAIPARPAQPAIGPSGVESRAPAGAVAYGDGRSRSVGRAAGSGGAGDHLGAPIHTGGPKRPAGAPADPGVRDDIRPRGPLRQDEPGRGPIGPGHWGAPVRRFDGPDHNIGYRDHWRGGVRPGVVGRSRWFHPGHRWPWLYRGAWVEGVGRSQTVMWAQACLSQLLGTDLPQDGFVGPDTQQAIASFQAQQNLPPSGTLDDGTVGALRVICGGLQERDCDGDPGEYEGFVDPFEGRDVARKPATSQLSRRAAVAQAQNLIDRFRTTTYAGKWHPTLSRREVADRLLTLINNPNLVNQGANGLCGEAAFFNVWLWEDPLAVARFGVQLFNSGAASIGVDEWVRTRPSLRSQNFNKVALQMQKENPNFSHAADWSAEWMLMSALRDANNWVISYDGTPSDKWGAGSSNREVTHWLRATGLFSKVSYEKVSHETGAALRLNPGNDIVLMACDSHMLGNPPQSGGPEDDHWLVLRSAIIDEDNATVNFRFWSWGMEIQWMNDWRVDHINLGPLSKSQFLNECFGYIRAKR
jgi:Putative peptidoglycan binding domain